MQKGYVPGMHDAVINGEMKFNIVSRVVFVSSENELAIVTDEEPAGTMAIQFGLKKMWQLKPDKTWEPVL